VPDRAAGWLQESIPRSQSQSQLAEHAQLLKDEMMIFFADLVHPSFRPCADYQVQFGGVGPSVSSNSNSATRRSRCASAQ
jgi:hypothetical protein